MNLFFRLMRVFLGALFSGRKMHPLAESRVRSRVWFTDQDVFGHMTNTRYNSFTDLAMMNYVVRSGAFPVMRKRGWYPVIVNEDLVFHRMLKFPERFEVIAQIVGFTDDHFCFATRFESRGRVIAEGYLIGRFASMKKERVTVPMVLQAAGWTVDSPPLAEEVRTRIEGLVSRRAELRLLESAAPEPA